MSILKKIWDQIFFPDSNFVDLCAVKTENDEGNLKEEDLEKNVNGNLESAREGKTKINKTQKQKLRRSDKNLQTLLKTVA